MTKREQMAGELLALGDRSAAWRAHLAARSGLPGPRANLELVEAFADVAPPALIDEFAADADEYLALCAAVALGRLLAEGGAADAAALVTRLRALAADERWRVREGVAMALQRVGDADPALLVRIVAKWSAGPTPLVARAAVAGVCEPRLLRDRATALAALDACERATVLLVSLPAQDRRGAAARTLRQGLGYCWSVAVAATPEPGLARFSRLAEAAEADADVAWIVRTNRSKARLARLLD